MPLDERTIWLDGDVTPMAAASTPLLSQSLQRGTLVFDVYGVYHQGTAVYGLGAREHTERFLLSADLMGMTLPYDVDTLLAAAAALVAENPGVDSVRLNAWWRDPSLDVIPVPGQPAVAIATYAVSDVHPGGGGPAVQPEPARLTMPGVRKAPPDVIPVQAKVAAAYAHASVAKVRARAAGFHDVLLLAEHGDIAESGTMSFFLVVDGVLRSPDLDEVLDGITRRVVLDAAAHEGIPVKVGPMPKELVADAEEAFLASTTRNVWPVASIDDRTFDPPGPVTARLIERVLQVVGGTDPLSPRWLQPL
jgi:branched-chain amino acid aminotransferase